MKIAPICLLTACKHRKFKLFGDSHHVRAIDNGIRCCYWSASLSNRLRALKAHSSLFKCCAKNCPNHMYWIQGKHRSSWVWVFLWLSVSFKLIFIVPFDLYSISIFFNSQGRVPLAGNSLRAEKSHWQIQKVTLAGLKSHTRAKMSHWGVIITYTCPICHANLVNLIARFMGPAWGPPGYDMIQVGLMLAPWTLLSG